MGDRGSPAMPYDYTYGKNDHHKGAFFNHTLPGDECMEIFGHTPSRHRPGEISRSRPLIGRSHSCFLNDADMKTFERVSAYQHLGESVDETAGARFIQFVRVAGANRCENQRQRSSRWTCLLDCALLDVGYNGWRGTPFTLLISNPLISA